MTMASERELHFNQAVALPFPIFELRGPLAKVDLSAWLSGLCIMGSVAVIGPSVVLADGFGLFLMVSAYMTFLVSVLLIQRHMRIALSAHTFGTPQELVSGGIFRFSRNPIYVAYLLPLAALGYYNPAVAIVATAFYITTMNLTVIRKEERDLHRCFGAQFLAYRNVVPRWIGI